MFFESDTFPFRFMLETCVHFDFCNKIFSNFSKGPPYDLGYFSFFKKIKKLKNTPNHRGDPMKNSKKFLFQKSKCTHVSSINLKGKVSHSKNIVTAVVYFWEFPCGSPCIIILYIKLRDFGPEVAVKAVWNFSYTNLRDFGGWNRVNWCTKSFTQFLSRLHLKSRNLMYEMTLPRPPCKFSMTPSNSETWVSEFLETDPSLIITYI